MRVGLTSRMRRRLPARGLRSSVVLAFATGALLISVILALGTYFSARHYLIEQRESTALRQAYTDAALVRDGMLTSGARVGDVLSAIALPSGTSAYVRARGGWYSTALTDDGPGAVGAVRRHVADGSAALMWTGATDSAAVVVGIPVPAVHAEYYEVTVAQELDSTLGTLRTALVVCALLTTAAGALLGWYAGARVLRPLNEVAKAAARISGGDLDARLDPSNDPDLATLVGSFNNMVDTVAERIAKDARFAADVSHELRTPLTTLTTALGVLRGSSELARPSRLAVHLMGAELERFRQALEDLIALGRLDSDVRESGWETLPMGELVRLALADHSPLRDVEAGGSSGVVVLRDRTAEASMVRVDRMQIRRALSNLLMNAQTHGGGLARVRIATRGRFVDVHIEDAGPGVPLVDRERIFERFARLGARDAKGGSGLGLSIVERTAAIHEGSVSCHESAQGGADFVLSLPVAVGERQ
ncbi:Signal transduction histidine kinase [Nocardioides terrae]|uniref:histidine kinase n=1 Tax=Nocardioides terrae TaxID=574651 RepID=A0A1I1JJS7_9ACTN|nr:ATP-binding protein [Nocardioides terrae]SFC48869.1 Signal transduction histidine kinase [Nocardioides terrae]